VTLVKLKPGEDFRVRIRARAAQQGFDVCRFASATDPWPAGARLREFVGEGRHGTMDWMEETLQRRSHPNELWPEARSAIVLGVNYGPDHDPRDLQAQADRGAISVYARGDDYHAVIKGRLKTFAGWAKAKFGGEVKVFIDTAPLMEKPLAERAGLGWQGKHTNLVSRDFGSWLFLGSVLTTIDLQPDEAESDHCGQCRACLDACPTNAFPAPYQIDARRCLSYLTIEHAGPWPEEFRIAAGNRIYGCDDCLAACPWNKFAQGAREMRLQARETLDGPPLAELAALDDEGFKAMFARTAVRRIGRERFLRNVLYAVGNSRDPALAGVAERALGETDPVARGAAVWALRRLLGTEAFKSLASQHLAAEVDASVRAEWAAV
jgi:epoxyqueuosine reductase